MAENEAYTARICSRSAGPWSSQTGKELILMDTDGDTGAGSADLELYPLAVADYQNSSPHSVESFRCSHAPVFQLDQKLVDIFVCTIGGHKSGKGNPKGAPGQR